MDPIVRKLRDSRTTNKVLDRQEYDEYYKKVEDILNHQLSDNESYVGVGQIELVSKTPKSITLRVDYEVQVSIPYYDEEAEREYTETEVEYRTRTMTIETSDLDESVVETKIQEFPTDSEAYEWAEENGYKVDKIQNGHGEKACICWMTKLQESIDLSVDSTFENAGFTWKILAKKGDYTLVYADKKKWNPYVVAWKLQSDGSWGQGHYFDSEDKARAYLEKKA